MTHDETERLRTAEYETGRETVAEDRRVPAPQAVSNQNSRYRAPVARRSKARSAKRRRQAKRIGLLYWAEDWPGTTIKVGFTTCAEQRLGNLNNTTRYVMSYQGVLPGSALHESILLRHLNRKYKRSMGLEYFPATPELRAELRSILTSIPDLEPEQAHALGVSITFLEPKCRRCIEYD